MRQIKSKHTLLGKKKWSVAPGLHGLLGMRRTRREHDAPGGNGPSRSRTRPREHTAQDMRALRCTCCCLHRRTARTTLAANFHALRMRC